ncbi:Crp/Fnr family transcriptional regulator [Campylobacter insulaenigrae]|uniref:Crp/Fnr family transcriptional regulator n=1 Tax=Campylobacter insulaenigrae TaxID=260714 RepID=UPI0021531827|nr:Crp/Fnr family transcriptional regulator [Campylobacter insulaenigrae]MCR6570164.1 Crp/Fnr family transcriptional regulator [Campylobacter insulaenigrae]MCR6576324.1 Crp/Fnr family transcriptional regulator [Campylobacter insulaenigrae]MCR6578294.1 Crp/Fnr family transcriptional regulator [Campylobacter insulaenigrae]MCR6582489.1 Crp/Fnr family transcriptional regulator [Campylobacter insulaenigrae]MCR6585571.1 Crp/Fnr family transcriptional regulator [Campylobacter insulaenigrae]
MEKYFEILASLGEKRNFKKGNILFFQGDEAKKILILLKGSVRLYRVNARGFEFTLHTLNSVSFIAEMPVFEGINYPANAICEEDCEICIIDFAYFKKICGENGEISFLLLSSLFEKIRILENFIRQKSLDLKTRLLKFLIENEEKLHQLKQKEIATILNIPPESLSRFLKEFKHILLIDTNKGKIMILNREKIQDLIKSF